MSESDHITEEFVRSIGFLPDGDSKEKAWFSISISIMDDDDPNGLSTALMVNVETGEAGIEEFDVGGRVTNSVSIPDQPTCGQLAMLMVCLGLAGNIKEAE